MTKHTPEPWDISWEEDEQHNSFIRVGPARIYIDPGRCEEEEAAAALISAAPELLEACKKMDDLMEKLMPAVDWGKTFNLPIRELNEAPLAVRRAIAKATGSP